MPLPEIRISDAELVERAAAGQREALSMIWDRHSPRVRSLLHRVTGSKQGIDDLVQEVFIGLMRGVGRIRAGSALRGYLASAAIRLAALEIRKRQRQPVRLSASGTLPDRPTVSVDPEGREALRALQLALGRVSARRQRAFALRHVCGLDVGETAERLGVSEATARRDLNAVRRVLLASGPLQNFLLRVPSRSGGRKGDRKA